MKWPFHKRWYYRYSHLSDRGYYECRRTAPGSLDELMNDYCGPFESKEAARKWVIAHIPQTSRVCVERDML